MKPMKLTQSEATLLQDGIAAAKAGEKASARTLLLKSAELDPHNEIPWLWLAYMADDAQQAIFYLKHALEIDPVQEQARAGLRKALLYEGINLAKAGDKAAAREALLEATELDSNNEIAWLWLASVADSTESAIICLERAIEINPENERSRRWLNKLRRQTEKPTPSWTCPLCNMASPEKMDKCKACGAVLSLSDPNAFAANRDADIGAILGAIERYRSLAEEGDFSAHYNLALAHLNLNKMTGALDYLQKAASLRPEDEELKAQVENILRQQSETQAKSEPAAPVKKEQPETFTPRTVLLVDDSPTVRKIVAVTLERRGHRVLVAGGAMEALSKLNEATLDLVLLDIGMPHMDGYQLCKLVKSNETTSDIPVVMLSGKDGFFDKVRGKMAGAVGYITKPFEPTALIEAVETYSREGGQN
ncbi:MAG TPA: response regulator [Blastocatellia bacterium]|jgi:twitching motility two-component system response regulator PilG